MHYLVKSHDLDVFEFDIERKQAYKDKQLCFEDQFEDIYQVKFVKIFSKNLLPAMLRENLEFNEINSEKNLKLLNRWIDSRQVVRNRKHAKELRALYDYDILKSFKQHYGKSLTDSYSIVRKDLDLELQHNLQSSSIDDEKIAQITIFGNYDEKRSCLEELEKALQQSVKKNRFL